MKTRSFQIFTFLVLALPLSAQSGKVGAALDGFLKTEFMQQFLDLRTKTETAARSFQKVAGSYEMEEVQKIETGYEQTANRANGILRGIVADFLDNKKMKYIAAYPDHYAKGLKADLLELSTFHATRFQQPLSELTDGQIDGMPWVLAIGQLISMTNQLVDYIGQLKLEKRHRTQEYLNANLYEPFRFRSWEELANGEAEADPFSMKEDERKAFNPLDSFPAVDTSGYERWEGAPGGIQPIPEKKLPQKKKGNSVD